jgi:hypothetical protein
VISYGAIERMDVYLRWLVKENENEKGEGVMTYVRDKMDNGRKGLGQRSSRVACGSRSSFTSLVTYRQVPKYLNDFCGSLILLREFALRRVLELAGAFAVEIGVIKSWVGLLKH